jgi:hypothetical protein
MKTTAISPVNGDATIMEQGEFEYWTATDHGIEFKDETPREVWLNAVDQISAMFESSGRLHCRLMFYMADALNAGERLFNEEFSQAIDNTRAFMRLSSKTIANAMWIAGKVMPLHRRETLSLAHHEVVAKLPETEQEEFLNKAETEGLTTKELKEAVREKHPGKPRSSKNGTKDDSHDFTIENATDAKRAATQLINWLKANEEKLGPAWETLLKDFYRMYDRRRKRATR